MVKKTTKGKSSGSKTREKHGDYVLRPLVKGGESGRYIFDIRRGGSSIGEVDFEINPATIHLLTLKPAYREKGIGGAIYKNIEKKFLDGGKDVRIDVYPSARRFWEKMGYHVDHVESFDANGKPYKMIMAKTTKARHRNTIE